MNAVGVAAEASSPARGAGMARRLLVSYLTLAAVVLAALEIPLGITYGRGERRDLTARIERDALSLASIVEDPLERRVPLPSAAARVARRYTDETGARVVVADQAGRSVLDTSSGRPIGRDFSTRPEIAAALRGEIVSGTRSSRTLGASLLYVAVPVASGGNVHGAVRVTYPTSTLDSRVRRYWLLLAAIAGVVLVAAAAIGLRFARTLARPLARLEAAAAAAGSGDLTVRAPLEGPPEVRELAARFNEMVSRLDLLLRSQQEFVADASHQLRTPLTALRLRLENLERAVEGDEAGDVQGALAEVRRLSGIVDGLLALARADAAAPSPARLELQPLVGRRLEAWTDAAREAAVALEAAVPAGVAALASRDSLEQVLDNLLSNALRHSPPGGRVRIVAQARSGWVELHVLDEGPGMTPEQRARALDRFWRGAGAGGGSGLGLPIAQRLVATDGGELELREAPSGGLDAVVRLPAA